MAQERPGDRDHLFRRPEIGVFRKAKAVILSANGLESLRLLLLSKSAQNPDGLANSNGVVGKYLMSGNVVDASGRFEHPLNEFKGIVRGAAVLDYAPVIPSEVSMAAAA